MGQNFPTLFYFRQYSSRLNCNEQSAYNKGRKQKTIPGSVDPRIFSRSAVNENIFFFNTKTLAATDKLLSRRDIEFHYLKNLVCAAFWASRE